MDRGPWASSHRAFSIEKDHGGEVVSHTMANRVLTRFLHRRIHSQTWDSIMPARVSSQISVAAGDSLSVAKYRVLPRLKPSTVEILQEITDEADAQYGTQHEASMKSLWAFAQWMETDDDAKGLVGGYSPRTRALFEELRRRGPASSMKIATWRFFADDHRARGERREAERSMREAIGAACEAWRPEHPLVLGYVSTLKDWLVGWYGGDSAEALEVTRWHAELKNNAMDPRNVPSQTLTGSPGSGG